MSSATQPGHRIIGWREYVDFPEWGIAGLRAKIDTGARSSALHVEAITPLPADRVAFDVVLKPGSGNARAHVVSKIVRRARVRSSNGEYSHRYFVRTDLQAGDMRHSIEVSLVDRGDLLFRLLVGRTALPAGVLVDVNRSYLLGRKRRSRNK